MEKLLIGYEKANKVAEKWKAQHRRLAEEEKFLQEAIKTIKGAIVVDREDGKELVSAYAKLCVLEGRRDERYKHWKQLIEFHSGVLMMFDAYKEEGEKFPEPDQVDDSNEIETENALKIFTSEEEMKGRREKEEQPIEEKEQVDVETDSSATDGWASKELVKQWMAAVVNVSRMD